MIVETTRIHAIESFGTLDGPGIRFVVFFQGCPLRCKFCHNRDTWDPAGGREVTLSELIADVRRYRGFLAPAGGGVTATGGEPLLHARFLSRFFAEVHVLGLTTALDTSGYTRITPEISALLDETDLVLLDLKHADDTFHTELVGVSNKPILAFARVLAKRRIATWIRYIVIPGHTTETEDVVRAAEFVASLSNVEKLELLPYHEMGRHKWEALGAEYRLNDTRPPSREELEAVANVFSQHGVPVSRNY